VDKAPDKAQSAISIQRDGARSAIGMEHSSLDLWKLEKRKIDRGTEGVQEEQTKCKKGYLHSKGKETEGMCKRFK